MAHLLPPPHPPRFSKTGQRRATILIAGPLGSGKRTLARQLAFDQNADFEATIRTRERLDVPTVQDVESPDRPEAYDLVVLLADSTSSTSLAWLQQSIRSLAPSWFLGRLTVCLTKLDQKVGRSVTMEDIRSVVDPFSPSVPCFPVAPMTRQDACRRIYRLLGVALRNEESLNETATILLSPSSRIVDVMDATNAS